MPIIKQTETANPYIQILDFIKTYGHKLYNKPDRIQDNKTKNEMLMLKQRAREITSMMRDISNRAVASSNLRLSNSIRWLNGSNIYIKDYLWAKLKYPRNSSPITISIFAENNNYRIALELDDKNATSNDYEFYKKYLDLHIDTSVLKFYGKQSSSDNLQILDLTQDQVIERLRKV